MVSSVLTGRRILVSRAREQSAGLTDGLRRHGAEVVEAPAIRIEPPSSWAPLDQAIQALPSYDWVLFTSVNGVKYFLQRMRSLGMDTKGLKAVKLAAIGPATREELETHALAVDVVPERFIAEEVFRALKRSGPLRGRRALLPRADIAREALPELLRKEGMQVDVVVAYRTVTAREDIRRGVDLVTRGLIDAVTFTSGSTVRSFFSAVEDRESLRGKFIPASIGPITSRALREQGFEPIIEAERYTTDGLIEAIVTYYRRASC